MMRFGSCLGTCQSTLICLFKSDFSLGFSSVWLRSWCVFLISGPAENGSSAWANMFYQTPDEKTSRNSRELHMCAETWGNIVPAAGLKAILKAWRVSLQLLRKTQILTPVLCESVTTASVFLSIWPKSRIPLSSVCPSAEMFGNLIKRCALITAVRVH